MGAMPALAASPLASAVATRGTTTSPCADAMRVVLARRTTEKLPRLFLAFNFSKGFQGAAVSPTKTESKDVMQVLVSVCGIPMEVG